MFIRMKKKENLCSRCCLTRLKPQNVTCPLEAGTHHAGYKPTSFRVATCTSMFTPAGRPMLALDFRFGALPLPFSGHSISFARLAVLLFSGHLPVFPRENAFSNNFQKNAAFWENPEKIWLKFGQNSAKFWKFHKSCKNQRKFQRLNHF